MQKHNKVVIAGDFLVEAHRLFFNANKDSDYARCILLAGAVIGVISPLLEEKGVKPHQVQLAEGAAILSGINLSMLSRQDRDRHISNGLRFYRYVSNALKHTGMAGIAASDDLLFEADLKDEA